MTVKLAIEFLKVIRQINLVKCSYEFGDKLNINIFRNRKSPSTCSIWKLIITQTLVNIKRYQRDIKNYAKTLIAVRASAFLDFSEMLTVQVEIWYGMHHCKNNSVLSKVTLRINLGNQKILANLPSIRHSVHCPVLNLYSNKSFLFWRLEFE